MAQLDTEAALAAVKAAMRQTLLANSEEHGAYLILSISLFTDDPFEPADPAAEAFAAGLAERLALIAPAKSEE